MKKVSYDQYGGPEVLRVVDGATPAIEKDKVLVRVKAASINPLDWKAFGGDMKIMTGFSFPKSVGIDFAGVVEQIGGAIKSVKVGDEVFGIADIFKGGAMSEYVLVPETTVAPKPANVTFEQAAAMAVVGASAIQIFEKLAPLRPGMDVLINGATGGIGTIATQLAKKQGTHVTAVVGPTGLELAKKLGSDMVINHEQESVLTKGVLYDVVLDFSGKLPFSEAEKIMKPASVYVSTTPDPIQMASAFAHNLLSKKKHEILSLVPQKGYLEAISRYVANGLDVVVSKTYSIDNVQQAYAEATKGGILGKAVVTV